MTGKMLVVGLLSCWTAMAQTPSGPAPAQAAKPLAFDVISIRQNTSPMGPQIGPPQFGPTPDGYRSTNLPLVLTIMTAYPPQTGGSALYMPDQVKGLPDWAQRDRYDIDARISEEDRAEWEKPGKQTAMLQAMMQSLLAERCKLVVHRESKDSSVYLLEVGKSGPKFKETDPTATHPPGMTLPGGATVVPSSNGSINLYGTSMAMLASLLSSMGGSGQNMGRNIQDKTGLTGRYDIVIARPDVGPRPDGQAGPAQFDPTEMVFSVVDALGLKLESAKSSVETLVIDHIEKPSAN